MEAGFTQLGRRLSAQEKREYGRRLELTILVINESGRMFRMAAFAHGAQMARGLGSSVEILFIDLDAAHSRIDILLAEFPGLRVIIPTRKMKFAEAVGLGMREALAPHVLVLDSATAIVNFELAAAQAAFAADKRLFAIGPALVDEGGSELPVRLGARLEAGRCLLTEDMAASRQPTLALRGFRGIVDREKALFVGVPEAGLGTGWAAIEWFYTAWARGWQTIVDPVHCLLVGADGVESFVPGPGFARRRRFYRDESLFLARHCRDRENRRGIVGQACAGLLRFDAALLFGWFAGRRLRERRAGAVLHASEVFARSAGGGAIPASVPSPAGEEAGADAAGPDSAGEDA